MASNDFKKIEIDKDSTTVESLFLYKIKNLFFSVNYLLNK